MLKAVEVPFAGHPDKICDQIVDGIVDEYLKRDPKSRVNIQALGSHGMLMIGGVADSRADFDVARLAQKIYERIGFKDSIEPFVNIEKPTEDMAKISVKGGAGATAVVYGYATKETREFLPKALVYAQEIARRVEDVRRSDGEGALLLSDGKVQVVHDGKAVVAVHISAQHQPGIEKSQLQNYVLEAILEPIIGIAEGVKLHINSAGTFSEGGFAAASGSSGKKELSDTYGGVLPWGGAMFTGKDPLHPARAGLYMSRFIAKQMVKKGEAANVLVSLGYVIGQKEPAFIQAVTGKGEDVSEKIKAEYDVRPEAIVERLNLSVPQYGRASVYGQFGREGFSWEDIES